MAYFQRAQLFDDYVDEFQDLVMDARYTDPKTIMVKFHRGLNAHIQNTVAMMALGRLFNTSLEDWYSMACVVDQN